MAEHNDKRLNRAGARAVYDRFATLYDLAMAPMEWMSGSVLPAGASDCGNTPEARASWRSAPVQARISRTTHTALP